MGRCRPLPAPRNSARRRERAGRDVAPTLVDAVRVASRHDSVHHAAMNHRRCRGALHVLLATFVGTAAPVLHAQQFINNLASGCGVPAVGGTFTLPTMAAVAVGDTIVFAVAGGSDAVPEYRVSDSRNNVYRAFGAERANARRFSVVNFLAPVTTGLLVGDPLRLQVVHPTPGMDVCVRATAFRRVAGAADALVTSGSGEATGTAITLDTGASAVSGTFNYASFAVAGTSPTVPTGSSVLQIPVCNGANTLCLLTAYQTGAATGVQQVTLNSAVALPWAGALSSFYASFDLFANGFE